MTQRVNDPLRLPAVTWRDRQLPDPERLFEVRCGVLFPDQNEATVINCPAYYLQAIRNGNLERIGALIPSRAEFIESTYERSRPEMARHLSRALHAAGVSCAAGVRPPSSRVDSRPYMQQLLDDGVVATDLSAFVERLVRSFRAATASGWTEVRESVRVKGDPPKPLARQLVVVDDIINDGRSIAATISALSQARLLPADAQFYAVALISIAKDIA